MTDTLLTLAFTTMVGKTIEVMTEKVLNSAWGNQYAEAKSIIEELNEPEVRKKYIKNHAEPALRIRTLLNPDSDVFLDDIYYPLTLSTTKDDADIIIGDNESLHFNAAINIVGIAGQGKSTALRKIFSETLKSGNRVPFFIELRRVENGDILFYLKNIISMLGITLTESNVEYLLQSGKVVLILDGFDEVKEENKVKIQNSIILLRTSFSCPLIISSRPNTLVCSMSGIHNLKVKDITLEDKLRILNLIDHAGHATNGQTFIHLCDLLTENSSLEETIRNPIMVTLLYHCFPYMDEVPSNITDFYRQLFGVLYGRHDKTKGYEREKRSVITAEPARKCFALLCLKSILQEKYELDSHDLYNLIESALQTYGYHRDQTNAFIDDLINVTCLLQSDGNDRFVFLHKSVQEFYAAFCITTLTNDEQRNKIYAFMRLKLVSTEKFDNMLSFLYHLDENSYVDNISIETFEEKRFNEYALMNSEQFTTVFDSWINDLVINGECLENSGVIHLNRRFFLSEHIGLNFLDVLKSAIREPDDHIDFLLELELNEGVDKSRLEEIKKFTMRTEIRKDQIRPGLETDERVIEIYSIDVKSFLVYSGLYELVVEETLIRIKSFNDEVYLPEKTRARVRDKASKDNFDFLFK